MSDKWWDMSDDELDDLFREASDKVEIPFDQSSLDKLKHKIDPKSAIIPKSRYKYESWLLLLFLLCFIGALTVYHFTKNNVSENLTVKAQSQKEQESQSENSGESAKAFKENIQENGGLTKNKSNFSEPDGKNSTTTKHNEDTSVEILSKSNVVVGNKVDVVSSLNKGTSQKQSKIYEHNQSLVKNKINAESFTKRIATTLNQNSRRKGISSIVQKEVEALFPQENLVKDNTTKTSENLVLLTGKPIKTLKSALVITLPEFEENIYEPIVDPLVKAVKDNHFGVRLVVAPDFNSVENLGDFAFGKSAGILFEYNITKRIVIQTGAIYSSKKYSTGIENYHAWAKNWTSRPVLPTNVEGDCQILDIPFNIRYNVLQKAKNTWFVSAGASSYLMLTEGYDYYYPEGVTVPTTFPKSVSWERDNDYFMSSLNISIGFEKRINKHISIQAEPYLKTPLKEVGRGKVNLYSSGVMFSLKYGF